jgi:hypothetical protein
MDNNEQLINYYNSKISNQSLCKFFNDRNFKVVDIIDYIYGKNDDPILNKTKRIIIKNTIIDASIDLNPFFILAISPNLPYNNFIKNDKELKNNYIEFSKNILGQEYDRALKSLCLREKTQVL